MHASQIKKSIILTLVWEFDKYRTGFDVDNFRMFETKICFKYEEPF